MQRQISQIKKIAILRSRLISICVFKIYAHKSILSITLKNNVDTLLRRFNHWNDSSCHSDLIELIIFYCYNKCLDPNKRNYIAELIKNKDGFLSITEHIEQLNELKNLIYLIDYELN